MPVAWTGHTMPVVDDEGALSMVPYHIENVHNEPWHIAKVEPGGGMRGPARELGAFYESLLGYRTSVVEPATVEMMSKVHRWGLRDAVFSFDAPWGLGVGVDFSGGTGRRAFGHGGMASSRGARRSRVRARDGDRRQRPRGVLRRRATGVRSDRRGVPRTG